MILKLEPRIVFSVSRYAFSTSATSMVREFLQPRPRTTILDCGIYKNFPEEYKKFYREWKLTTPKPVHYIPQEGTYYKNEENGMVYHVQNVPIPLSGSNLEDVGIWGGEAVIDGRIRNLKGKHRIHDLGPVPKFWYPSLFNTVIYSEVLNKHMTCTVTTRAQILINNHFGLDYYLLETRACDLRNLLAVQLKRKILLALRDKTLYPNDQKKQEEVYDKFKKYLDDYTPKEIEWYGLTLKDARIKLAGENIRLREKPKEPLKHQYRREFIEELQLDDQQKIESKPWYKQKLLPFK